MINIFQLLEYFSSFIRIVLAVYFFLQMVTQLGASPMYLANLEYSNPKLKSLRNDVKENLRASRSHNENIQLTKLEFYVYTVSKSDNFFTIMARTGMNLDSLSSVNELASPQDIFPGQKILIPNMRGVYYNKEIQTNSDKERIAIAKEFKTLPEKLFFDESRSKWFVPGGDLQGREKMFFYGFGFAKPLLASVLSSGFGKRNDPFTRNETFHGGVDLAAPQGTPVFASADGEIIFRNKKGGYGNLIIIKHELGYETRYGHLSKFLVKMGTKVKKGDKIGEVGHTGRATGDHLHFEVRRFSKRQKPVFTGHL
ncbi:LysM peptidoglycan-binding domain-containing M23 family metallopeptidase [Leptospira sp. GIMC2001]|uniref:LysM peptidoglycan-binding domain-containing M23 family metallopeptidase n=1 Tax=Leptospira sp. GIMC2001 TaxID=1513297 RepID=UPI003FA54BE5